MRTEKIFIRLDELGVNPIHIGSLRIQFGGKRSWYCSICITVSKILTQFESDKETEDEVTELLDILMKRHFNNKGKKDYHHSM